MTPVFAHGHLRLYLLSLLSERSMHGYELIQALSDRFGGTYIPSAGTIYPRLAKLGEEGLVSREADGRKTVYSITDAGLAELLARQADLDEIERGVTTTVRSLADEVRSSVADAMRTLRADLAARDGSPSAHRDRTDAADAPAPSHPAPPSPSEGRQGEQSQPAASAAASSRRELREAELVLAEFRDGLRRDLRSRAATGSLPAGAAGRLRGELESLRAEFLRGDAPLG